MIENGLAQVIRSKDPISKLNLDNHAKNVEAILINPNWNLNPNQKHENK